MPDQKDQRMQSERTCTVPAPGKINLSLDVTGRREDGYHLLSSVMQTVQLGDTVTVTEQQSRHGIRITSDRPGLPTDASNTVHVAAMRFAEAAGMQTGLTVHIGKRIPEAGGMGGGSADAAAVLRVLSEWYPDAVPEATLRDIACSVGADVPFCLEGGTVLCEGIGERLTPLPAFTRIPTVLISPLFPVSTRWVFQHYDQEAAGIRPDHARVLEAVRQRDLRMLAGATANVLETVTLPAYPVLTEMKRQLMRQGAVLAQMTGSGPTLFGLFEDPERADRAAERIRRETGTSARVIRTET